MSRAFRLNASRVPRPSGWMCVWMSALMLLQPLFVERARCENARVYMFPADADNLEPSEVKRLEELLSTRVSQYKALDVVTESAARAIIARAVAESALAVDSECARKQTCLTSLAGLLHSQYILRTGMIGARDRVLINAELVESKNGVIVSKIEWTMPRPITEATDDLGAAIDAMMAPLDIKGEVLVISEAAHATVLVDAKEVGTTGEKALLTLNVPVGTHRLSLTHPDYNPITQSLLITAGRTIWEPNQLTYEETATPIYATWWFWTVLAVAVGGGFTTWYLLQPKDAEAPTLPPPDFGSVVIEF